VSQARLGIQKRERMRDEGMSDIILGD